MRNLKRALSLALAFIMVMGLMIVGTSAKSYTDSDKIENQAAVEILGEIGVMIGNEDGSFAPDRVVTRAEMAVIITRILYGNNLNVDQFKGLNTFTDVPEWADGFVNLCASLGIVAGRGNGIFDPNATVTTAEAVLMLSRALGYFQNPAEFGDNWQLASMKRATQVGIIGGDMVLQASEGLTRDDVALVTFNTLTKAVPVQYNELLNVYYNVNQGVIYALEFNYLQTLGYTNFSLVYKTNDSVEYGRPATTWGIGSYNVGGQTTASGIKKDKLTSEGGLLPNYVRMLEKDEIITVTNTPVYTYTNSTSQKDIYSDLGAAACNQVKDVKYDWTAFTNGEEVDAKVPAKNNSSTYDFTGKGAVTEIYVDDDAKTVTVVEINYYLGQVASVDEDKDTVTIRTVSDLKADNAKLDDRTFATTEFGKDDYVVFTIDQDSDDDFVIREMMAPETVDGTVTRVDGHVATDDAYLYLDKQDKYNYSFHMAYDLNAENNGRHPELEKEYTLYLDPNGYVLAYSTDISKNFLYVEDSDEELVNWDANVVLDNGSDAAIDVDTDIKGIRGDENILYLDADEITDKFNLNGGRDSLVWLDSHELSDLNYVGTKISNIDYEIFEYETNSDGVYTLTDRTTKYATGVQINNGKAYMQGQYWPTDVTIDNSTIFVDVQNNKAYTGYSEVPDVSHAKIAYVLKGDNDRAVAEIVYIIEGDFYDADAIFFVVTDSNYDSEEFDGDNYMEFDEMYVDGRKTTGLFVSYDAVRAAGYIPGNKASMEKMEGKVFKALKSTDGKYITEIELVTNWDPAAVATSSALDVMDGNFWMWWIDNWNWARYTTNNDTTYVMVEEQYNKSVTELTGYDVSVADYSDIIEWVNGNWTEDEDGYMTMVSVVKDDDQAAQLVYIWKFNPDYRTRDITVTLDGEVIDTQNIWWSDTDISGASDKIGELDGMGYTFTSNIGEVAVDGTAWAISDIPTGHTDLTINITSSSVDVLTKGNLTLNTLKADYNGDYGKVFASNIWLGESNKIYYNFTVKGLSDLENATVTWTETIVADGTEKTIVNQGKTAYTIDGDLVLAATTPNPDFNASNVVTIYISDLKVTEEPEVATIDATATLTRSNTTLTATVKTEGNVGGTANFQLQVSYNGETWVPYGTVGTGAFNADTATCTFTVEAADAVRLFRVVASGNVQYGAGQVDFEAISTAIS